MRTLQLADITEFFSSSKEGKAILAARERTELAERQAHVDTIDAIKRDLDGRLPGLRAEESAAKAEHERAHQALLAAAAKDRAAMGATMDARTTADARIAQHENALRQTANPAIAAFRREVVAMLDRDRQLPAQRNDTDIDVGGYVQKDRMSTRPNIHAHVMALISVRDELWSWPLLALTDAEVETKIADTRIRLAHSLAKTREYTPITV